MTGGLAAGGAASVQRNASQLGLNRIGSRQFHKNTADFFDFLVYAEKMLVAQQISETELPGLTLCFGARVERTILGPKLFGGVSRHPESFFICHLLVLPWVA